MELPIAKQSYLPSVESLVRALKRADVVTARMAAEQTELPGALAFTNTQRPCVPMVNFAAEVAVPEGTSAAQVIDTIEAHFAERGTRCGWLIGNDLTWPEALAQAAEARGYKRSDPSQVYLLDHFAPPPAEPADQLQIIPARAAYRPLREFLRHAASHEYGASPEVAEQMADTHIDHLDEPRLELFLGRLDGRIVGLAGVVTLGNIGVIYWVYTDPEHRRRGVARRLMTATLEHCVRAQFECVILEAYSHPAATGLYRTLGFKPIATIHKYIRST